MKQAETKDRIKEALSIREMKQSELVEKTGIDKGQMSSYLAGRYKPKQTNLNLIAKALSVDEAWLMGYDVPMERHECNSQNLPKITLYYEMLNDIGKYEATKRVEELTQIPKYIKQAIPTAAHADDYAHAPEELKQLEDDIMADKNF